jgi:hypothetical protein
MCMSAAGFVLVLGFGAMLHLTTTCNNNNSHLYSEIYYEHAICHLNQLFLHKSPGNGFQRRTFLFLWVPKLSKCLSHGSSHLTPQALLLSQENLLQTESVYTAQEACIVADHIYTEAEAIWRSMVTRPVCLGVGHPFRAYDNIFITV